MSEDQAGPQGGVPDRAESPTPLDRTVKGLESAQLLRSAVPLIAAGIGVSWMYTSVALDDAPRFWIGVPLALVGTACAIIGYLGRLREIRSPRPSTGRHYPWLFIGWALVLAGLLIPPYSLA